MNLLKIIMEGKMKQKTINIILIMIIVLIVIIPTIWYVNKTHNDDLWLVVNKEVIESANKCKNENVCNDDTVTIKFLIDNNYIEKIYDPITKEAINEASYVNYNSNTFEIVNN